MRSIGRSSGAQIVSNVKARGAGEHPSGSSFPLPSLLDRPGDHGAEMEQTGFAYNPV